jgi:hypothetical protein
MTHYLRGFEVLKGFLKEIYPYSQGFRLSRKSCQVSSNERFPCRLVLDSRLSRGLSFLAWYPYAGYRSYGETPTLISYTPERILSNQLHKQQFFTCFRFCKPPDRANPIPKIATLHVVHHQKQIVTILVGKYHINDKTGEYNNYGLEEISTGV